MNQDFEKVKEMMIKLADAKDKEAKNYAEMENNAPCVVCGNKEFVQKFRNVVGEISGNVHGNFSLFGGSICGSIDGDTKTLPVLSCRKCENERAIATWNFVHGADVFWDFMHNFYFGIDDNDPERFKNIDKFFLDKATGTRLYMLENRNYKNSFYNEIPQWSPATWAKAGFKIPMVVGKHRFLWKKWEEEVYPSWEELAKL